MKLFYEAIPESISEEKKIEYLDLIDDERKDSVLKKIERGQLETLYANMLAKRELAKILGCEMKDVRFTFGKNGKPLLKNEENLFFNISHSGSYAAVAIAEKPVGVDIEKIRSVSESVINRVCTDSEKAFLETSEDKNRDFIKLWTLKECAVKASGAGLADNLKNHAFDISEGKAVSTGRQSEIFVSEEIDGYILSAMTISPKKEKTREELIRRSVTKKFRKTIWNNFIGAVKDYELISPGDKIAVCISGGKDSMLLAVCIKELIAHSQIPFEAKYMVMDPGYNEMNRLKILSNAEALGLEIHIFDAPIFDYVSKQDGSPCYLCARMRRGYLYKQAQELGCNKIALGHHFDDVIETTLLNLFYGSEIKTMMPKLKSTNFPGMELIRPLYCVKEESIKKWAQYNDLEFIRCACRFTEQFEALGLEDEQSHKREEIKALIAKMRENNEYVDTSIFKSMHNVNLSTIVAYREKDGGDLCKFTENY
ncbi:MAG: 4'-phosphopantetheinyl transferase superfamily protein [Clostridia bacterium]|nr:4'-phosphopantetheinyl transferase superfamily protein [Clostridia bacterium]